MLLILLLCLFFPSTVSALNYQDTAQVSISASIGDNRITIFGYTSPHSRVELSSPRVFAVTYSDDTGYWLFDKVLLPKNPLDLCLNSTDENGRYTAPVCIPAPPPTNYHTDTGPILLPPTISLDRDQINPYETVVTSGQSIPNSQVYLLFFKVNDSGLSFPRQIFAYSLPPLLAATDSQGNFSVNLPTAYNSDYRLYASSRFKDNYSPKSNTLIYILPSLFILFLQKYPFLAYLLPLFFFSLMTLFYLLHLRHLKSIPVIIPPPFVRHLPVPRYLPAIRQISLQPYSPHHPATTSCRLRKSHPNPPKSKLQSL